MRCWPRLIHGTMLLALLLGGCQRAGRYGAAPTRPARTDKAAVATGAADTRAETPPRPEPLKHDLAWLPANPALLAPPVPLVFVHEGTSRADWRQLPHFWNVATLPPRPAHALALLGGGPWLAAGLAVAGPREQVVRIKVPLGLDDPTAYLPPTNPPTLQKWELGKRLFFDAEHILPGNALGEKESCASCHNPQTGYTAKRVLPNPPTLINSVYNTYQFWDGRAAQLEEVVQRTLDDERDTPGSDQAKRHVWPGVVERLRAQPTYVEQFQRAFGTPPTQDAVGKALAVYLRTLLSGHSIHDQAEQAQRDRGGNRLEAGDYDKVVTPTALKTLLETSEQERTREDAVHLLYAGYNLFHGKAACVLCHGGRQFGPAADQGFHNLGVGDSGLPQVPGAETGRFAVLPPGLKESRLIGAYKTPTLRALPRTGPYLHTGERNELFDVVRLHVKPPPLPNLDAEIRDRGLTEPDLRALVLFLRALDGDALPPVLTDPAWKATP